MPASRNGTDVVLWLLVMGSWWLCIIAHVDFVEDAWPQHRKQGLRRLFRPA